MTNQLEAATASITTEDGHFVWKKRPKGFGLRRNLKVSRAHAPKPVTEQPESKSLCVVSKPVRSTPLQDNIYDVQRTFNANELYTYEFTGVSSSWRGTLFKKRFNVVFDLVIDTLPQPETVMMICILDLAAKQYQDLGSFYMFMGFELRHSELVDPIILPYRPIDNVNIQSLIEEVRRLKHGFSGLKSISHNEFTLDICFVKQLLGSGVAPKTQRQRKSVKKDFRMISENNVENYCLGTVILQGMAYVKHTNDLDNYEVEKEWYRLSILNDSSPEYSADMCLAKQLLLDAGVAKAKDYTIKDVTSVQEFLSGQYQIVVFSEEHNKSPIYKGPSLMEKNIIALVCKNGHYQLIKKLPQFVGAGFYCVHCNSKSATLSDHYSCPLRCRLCASMNCMPEDGYEVVCEDCQQSFYSEQCLKTHKMKGILGKRSRCEKTLVCPNCKKLCKDMKRHKCHNYYCQHCKVIREKGHQCSLPPKDHGAAWGFPQKRIYFLVKTEKTLNADGTLSEKPILILAIRFCPECRAYLPTRVVKGAQMTCNNCSPDGCRTWLFDCILRKNRGKDVMLSFLKWLIHKHHIRFAAVSHNISEAVSDLIMKYMTREDVPKHKECIVENGRLKYMVIEGSRQKFTDSDNFIPTSIKEFSKALSVWNYHEQEGYFPIKFLTSCNIDYIGPVPSLEMYLTDDMSQTERDEIIQFHSKESSMEKVFNFQDALIKHTYLELVQMALCFITLETITYNQLGVRLFEESPNIYRAAISGFRRKFHSDNCLPLDKGFGSQYRQTFSMTAMKYLSWRAHREKIPIDTAVNVGEYRVPGTPFHLDGFIQPCEKYPRGLGIDVKGCYWHAHGCTYVPQMVARRELKIDTIRANDKKRDDEVRRHIDFEVVWECQIALQRMTDPEMDTFMNQCNFEGKADIVNAISPLYSETFHLQYQKTDGERIFCRDITDVPGICMKLDEYPSGPFRRLHGEYFKVPITESTGLGDAKGLVYCQVSLFWVLPPKELFVPVLQYKWDGEVILTLCRTCAEQKNYKLCQHCDAERILDGTWTTFELQLALEQGYVITRAIHWNDWMKFSANERGEKQTSGIFSDFVDAVLGNKIASAGYPARLNNDMEREKYIVELTNRYAIPIDKDIVHRNAVAQSIDDALLQIWKTFSEKNDKPVTELAKSPGELWKTLEDPTMQVKEIKALTEDTIYYAFGKKKEHALPLFETVTAVEALTASHVRVRIYRFLLRLEKLERDLLYIDEKRIIYRGNEEHDPLFDLAPEYPRSGGEGEIREYISPCPGQFLLTRQVDDKIEFDLEMLGFDKVEAAWDLQTQAIRDQVNFLMNNESDSIDISYEHIERDSFYLLRNVLKTQRLESRLSSRFVTIQESGLKTWAIGTFMKF
ncbi:unnamed protein product [Auanema sp. JU1783]|nr:unnamed protein product [Auanema sp. JU1783]